MASTVAVQQSRVIPVGVDDAFAGTLPIPLTTIFRRWCGPIPPVAEVREQEGEWGTPAQTRVVAFVGPGEMREKLVSVDPPRSFGYAITGISGPLGLLVGNAEGKWTCTPSGGATTVTWQWTIHAASAISAALLPLVGALWKGYAHRSLAVLSTELTR